MNNESLSPLLKTIEEFENARNNLNELIRRARQTYKDLRAAQIEVEDILKIDTKKLVEDKINKVVKDELDKIGNIFDDQTNLIYNKVSREIDRLINLCLGKSFNDSLFEGGDLRPKLALMLREWLKEELIKNLQEQ